MEMPSYNEDIEEKQPHAEEDSRRGYYRVAPISDEDISMKSINDHEAVPGSNKRTPVHGPKALTEGSTPPKPRHRTRNW